MAGLSAQDASLATLDEAARDFLEAARDLPLAEWVIELVPLDRSPIAQVLFLGFGVVLLTAFALRLCRHHSDPSDWWQGKIRTSIPYEPDENILASLLRFEGTALQLVFAKPLYWALIAMHIGLRHANDHFLMLPPLDSTVLVGLPSSLLIFLVVFYGGNCYQRYYELWEHLSALNAGVYNWVLQTGFIYSPLEMNHEHLNKIASKLHGVGRNDGTDEKAKNERYRRIRLAAMWRCSRRMLAAFHLLIRTVDPDDPSSSGGLNFLGQVRREWSMRESPFKGRGLEEEDYKQLMQLQVPRLTPSSGPPPFFSACDASSETRHTRRSGDAVPLDIRPMMIQTAYACDLWRAAAPSEAGGGVAEVLRHTEGCLAVHRTHQVGARRSRAGVEGRGGPWQAVPPPHTCLSACAPIGAIIPAFRVTVRGVPVRRSRIDLPAAFLRTAAQRRA